MGLKARGDILGRGGFGVVLEVRNQQGTVKACKVQISPEPDRREF
jgi:hypothetical protein